MYEVAILLVGGVIGAAVMYLVCRAAAAGLRAQLVRMQEVEAECSRLREASSRAQVEAASAVARAAAVEARVEELQSALAGVKAEAGRIAAEKSEVEARVAAAQATVARVPELEGELMRGRAELVRLAGVEECARRVPGLEAELRNALAANTDLEARLAQATQRHESEQQAWKEKFALLQDAERKLSDAFKALSAEALRTSNEEFLKLAQTALQNFQENAQSDLQSRQKAIGELVQPLRESLTKVDTKLQEIEVARATAYSGLSEQVKALAESQTLLRSETANLVKALRAPAARGRWGEIQLQRVVEIAGMLEHCDFNQQATIESADGRLRPDLVVHLPYGRHIIVDSKVPLDAYLDALDAQEESARASHLSRHAVQLRTHIGKLAAKQYWAELEGATDFVIAFIPGEVFFSAALQSDPGLLDYGIEQRVLVATPTTLIALLKAVAYGWRQESVAQNAQEISRLGREVYERLTVLADHMTRLGRSLNRATDCYNEAVGSLETRVLVSARKMKEKGIGHDSELTGPDPIDQRAREIRAPELIEHPAVAGV